MASERIEIMNIRQLLRLKSKGESNRSVARLVGIHRNSVNDYVRLFTACGKTFESLLELSDKELEELFPSFSTINKSRHEELSSYFHYFRRELKKPGCTRLTLWKAYLEKHPEGYSYTQFNEHFNRWLNRIKGSGKLDHKAGDKLYVDYTGKKLSYIDKSTGEVIEVEVFVGALPCSGFTYVEATHSQKREDFILSMNNCFGYIGGVTKAAVSDNLKSAVTKASKYEPILNKTFKDFGLHYGCVINPTRSYAAQDKAYVEGTVKLVYQRIFYPLSKMTFFSLQSLNDQIAILLEKYNDHLLSQIPLSRRQQFISIERSFLSPLPAEKYEIRYFKRATVQKMGYVYLHQDKHYYSAPHRYIGKKVELRYNSQVVEIHYNKQRIGFHKRSYTPGKYTTVEDHLSSTHRFYQDWSPEFFEKLATPFGPAVKDYVKALIDQASYPETAYKQCLGIIALAKKYGRERLDKACTRAMLFHRYGYHIIKNILDNNMDRHELDTDEEANIIPAHENIRGANHYQ